MLSPISRIYPSELTRQEGWITERPGLVVSGVIGLWLVSPLVYLSATQVFGALEVGHWVMFLIYLFGLIVLSISGGVYLTAIFYVLMMPTAWLITRALLNKPVLWYEVEESQKADLWALGSVAVNIAVPAGVVGIFFGGLAYLIVQAI